MSTILRGLAILFCAVGLVVLGCTNTPSSAESAKTVLVFGATGRLGAPHVKLLSDAGHTVIAFHRSTSNFDRLEGLDYQRVEGDLMDAESVLQAMVSTRPNVVIDTTARRGARLRTKMPYYDIAMKNIVDAAERTGVDQVIIHSSVGVEESEDPNMLDKLKAERTLASSQVNYTIIRNYLLVREPALPTGAARLTEDRSAKGYITRTDLAGLSVGCVVNADCLGKLFHAVDDTIPLPARFQ